MPWESLVAQNTISLVAGADLTNAQGRFVTLDSTGAVILADAATDSVVGVLLNKPGLGQAAAVAVGGVVEMVAGGAVGVGARVGPDANGRAVASGATDRGFGVALTAATAAGQTVSVLLMLTAALS